MAVFARGRGGVIKCPFELLLFIGLRVTGVLSALPGSTTRSVCQSRAADYSEIGRCSVSCNAQLTYQNPDADPTILELRAELAAGCNESCHKAYTQQMCYCRGPKCISSLPCLTACGYTGVYDELASSLALCARTTVDSSRRLSMKVYWLPLQNDTRLSLGLVDAYYVRYFATFNFNSNETYSVEAVDSRINVSSSPVSFDISVMTKVRKTKQLVHHHMPYNVDIHVLDIAYKLAVDKVTSRYREFPRDNGNGDLLFPSPQCRNVADQLSQCADEEFAVNETTNYYDPLVISSFTALDRSSETPPTSSPSAAPVAAPVLVPATVVAAAGDNVSYALLLEVAWEYEPFGYRRQKTSYGCTPHSCWCWDSCQVQHHGQLMVTIGNTQRSLLINTTQELPDFLHCPVLRFNKSLSINFPVSDFYDSALDGYNMTRAENVSVSARIRSYYSVDQHFGPQRATYNFTDSLTNAVVRLTGLRNKVSDTTSQAALTPVTNHTEAGSGQDGGVATAIIVPVVMVSVLLPVFVLVVIFIWSYQKWHPRCVSRNSTLEKRQQIRVNSTFHNSVNTSYQSAARCTGLKDDWQTVPRHHITLESELGSGQFGDVYRATVQHLNSREATCEVAVKVLKQGSTEKDEYDFLREASHLKNFRHPNVIRLLGVCLDANPKMILLELMDGGDLLSYLQSNQPGAARPAWDDAEYIDIALDITAGLRYLETEKYVHRDIAARNCLVSFQPQNSSLAVKPSCSGRIVKLADFGLARDIDRRDYYRIMGDKALVPIRWMAPESLQDKLYTGKSDVWSFGILLWEIFTYGQIPYGERTNVFDVYKFVTMGGMLDQPQFCPTAMYRLMKTTWASSPNDRPNFRQLHNHLSTFQKSLSRRKTLLTTLASFASVSGVADVDHSRLPHIPASERVMVPPRASSAEGSVFDNDDDDFGDLSDNAFGDTPSISDQDSAANSPFSSPVPGRHVGRHLTPNGYTWTQDGTPKQHRRHPRSRASTDGLRGGKPNGGVPVKTIGSFPVRSNGHGAHLGRGYGYVPTIEAANGDTAHSCGRVGVSEIPPIIVTEFSPRKPHLSPIVSASSAPGEPNRAEERYPDTDALAATAASSATGTSPTFRSGSSSSGACLMHCETSL